MKKVIPFTKTITFKTMIAEITDIEVKHTLSLTENHELTGDILVDGTYKMTDASQIEEEFHYKLPFMIEIDPKYDLENLEIAIGDFYFEIINEEDLKINVEIDLDGLEEIKQEDEIATKISLEKEPEVLEEPMILEEPISSEELSRNELEEAIPIPVELEEEPTKVEMQDVNMNPLEKLELEIKEDLQTEDPSQENLSNSIVEKKETESKVNVSSIFSSVASGEETFSTYYVYIVRESDTVESIIDKYKTTREQLQNYNDLSDVKVGTKLIIPCCQNE